jgi:hypothetical protein
MCCFASLFGLNVNPLGWNDRGYDIEPHFLHAFHPNFAYPCRPCQCLKLSINCLYSSNFAAYNWVLAALVYSYILVLVCWFCRSAALVCLTRCHIATACIRHAQRPSIDPFICRAESCNSLSCVTSVWTVNVSRVQNEWMQDTDYVAEHSQTRSQVHTQGHYSTSLRSPSCSCWHTQAPLHSHAAICAVANYLLTCSSHTQVRATGINTWPVE